MKELIAVFIVLFGLSSFGQENQISNANPENINNVQELDATFKTKISEEALIGVWYTTAISHSKYRTNPYPRNKDRYSFKKDFSIVFVKKKKMNSGTWSLSENNTLTITTTTGKIVYRISSYNNGVLNLVSSNYHITLKQSNN